MYGISKQILHDFSVLTTPSFGTIKPALKRLEKSGFVKLQKYISEGGRPSAYYSISEEGKQELKRIIIEQPLENPIHFLPMARIKLACSDILSKEEKTVLLKNLKLKAEILMSDTKNLMEKYELPFYPKMVFDNILCEYKNFLYLIEGFEHAGRR